MYYDRLCIPTLFRLLVPHSPLPSRVVNQLLTEMDGVDSRQVGWQRLSGKGEGQGFVMMTW